MTRILLPSQSARLRRDRVASLVTLLVALSAIIAALTFGAKALAASQAAQPSTVVYGWEW